MDLQSERAATLLCSESVNTRKCPSKYKGMVRRYLKPRWVIPQSGREGERPIFNLHFRARKMGSPSANLSQAFSAFLSLFVKVVFLLGFMCWFLLWVFERGRRERERKVDSCWSIMANFIGWVLEEWEGSFYVLAGTAFWIWGGR